MASKQILRDVFLAKRLQLSSSEFADRNRRLRENLIKNLNLTKIALIHTFLGMSTKNEVDTKLIIDEIKQNFPKIKFAVPRTLPNGLLDHYILDESCVLEQNKWGIEEPTSGIRVRVDPEAIDLVFVPLIIFDKDGHRIGYGGGYYDRFLKQAIKAKKIGLSLLPPIDKIEYTENTDVKLDGCITPNLFYQFD